MARYIAIGNALVAEMIRTQAAEYADAVQTLAPFNLSSPAVASTVAEAVKMTASPRFSNHSVPCCTGARQGLALGGEKPRAVLAPMPASALEMMPTRASWRICAQDGAPHIEDRLSATVS